MKNRYKIQAQFDDRYVPIPEVGCWLWIGDSKPADRLSWTLSHGSKPGSLHVCHRCSTTGCVNPDHMYLETN